MTTNPPTEWFADLLRAQSRLEIKDLQVLQTVAKLLGAPIESERSGAATPLLSAKAQSGSTPPLTNRSPSTKDPLPIVKEEAPRKALSSELTIRRNTKSKTKLKIIPLPAPTQSEKNLPPPPLEPLFPPSKTQEILYELTARKMPEGELNTDALIEVLACRRPLDRLPRHNVNTIRFGIQVLLDVGESMALFRRDQEWLSEQLYRLIGQEHVQKLRFRGTPLRGAGIGLFIKWPKYYLPPPKNTSILLLTDLGIGPALNTLDIAHSGEWLSFAEMIRNAGCFLTALVPYKSTRWPKELVQKIPIIHWDRTANFRIVRNRLCVSK